SVSLCYHFTCDQIAHKLIPSEVKIPGKYACVVFEFQLPEIHPYFYDELYLRDVGSDKVHRFIDVFETCNYCVEGKGPWEVLLRGSYPIECKDEIIVLFTSQPTKVLPSNREWTCDVPNYELSTIVAPNSGAIQLTGTPSTGSVKVYLGVGRDEE
ncbi:hypothetical protein PMAYCL1PPCAC_08560, partial [Pristionchus mayeri]